MPTIALRFPSAALLPRARTRTRVGVNGADAAPNKPGDASVTMRQAVILTILGAVVGGTIEPIVSYLINRRRGHT